VVLPTPEHRILEGRGEIGRDDTAFLTKGATTLEEVLLRYGEPDAVLCDDNIIVYHWKVCWGYWGIVVPGPGVGAAGGGDLSRDYLLLLEFNDQARLRRWQRRGKTTSVPPLYRIREWAYSPQDPERRP
jgi:hypothetical protein